MFGSKEEEVMGGWRQLNSEELHDLYVLFAKYYWDDQIKKEKMEGYKHAWGDNMSINFLKEKPEGKRLF
jgi:hypothetical protein